MSHTFKDRNDIKDVLPVYDLKKLDFPPKNPIIERIHLEEFKKLKQKVYLGKLKKYISLCAL